MVATAFRTYYYTRACVRPKRPSKLQSQVFRYTAGNEREKEKHGQRPKNDDPAAYCGDKKVRRVSIWIRTICVVRAGSYGVN
jgi:hypothetical protein